MVNVEEFAGDSFRFIGNLISAFFRLWFSFYNRIGFLNAILAMIFAICVFRFVVVPFVGSAHFNVAHSMQRYREARDLNERRGKADAERAERNKRTDEYRARHVQHMEAREAYWRSRDNKNKSDKE